MVYFREQSTPNFPKNDYFLPPDTHMYVCFLETPVLRFTLLPYYRRNLPYLLPYEAYSNFLRLDSQSRWKMHCVYYFVNLKIEPPLNQNAILFINEILFIKETDCC